MSLLIPDTGLLFWMLLSFGIVFSVLAKYGFPVITRAAEERSKYIKDALADARRAEESLVSLNEQAKAILDKANGERNAILSETQEAKNRILNAAREKGEAEARQRMNQATAEIEELKHRALNEIKDQIAGISVAIAEKVLGEKLNTTPEQKTLIDRLLKQETTYKS